MVSIKLLSFVSSYYSIG